jgi:hypothetical protein
MDTLQQTLNGGPVLHVVLAVKFRAFGVTLGTVNYSHDVPMPLPLEWVAENQTLVGLDQNGVSLHITLEAQVPVANPFPVVVAGPPPGAG